jgi:hypothetical protein
LTRRLAATTLAGCALLLPGCGEEATEDNVVDAVPAEAQAYIHMDRESGDWDDARESLAKLPALESGILDLLEGAVGNVPGESEAGVARVPGRDQPLVVGQDDAPATPSLDALDDYQTLVDGLPEQRFVHGYVSRDQAKGLRGLDASIASAAAGLDLDDGLARLRVRARHDRDAGPCSAGVSGDELLDLADPDAAVYLEVPSVTCAIRAVAGRVDGGEGALRTLARAARRQGNVSLDDEILPFLEKRGALIATPGKRAPTITLVVDDVDEAEALDLLARLQPAVIHLLQPQALGQAPTFGSAEVAGITAATARLAPGLELSYAAWDDRLVISTSLDGIRQIRRAEGLAENDAFEDVLGDRPDESSALLFVDLDQLLALGEQAGLAEDPRYLAVRDDLQKLRAAGAVLSREEKYSTAELTFQIP